MLSTLTAPLYQFVVTPLRSCQAPVPMTDQPGIESDGCPTFMVRLAPRVRSAFTAGIRRLASSRSASTMTMTT